MIYDIFGFDFSIDFEILQLVIYCALLGNLFRFLLSFVHNQYWTRSRLQFLNFSFLPCITFIITKIIAGNIALSLGMVGALSIVRLRTPVKNPFELVAYFFLITLGIITSVNPNIAINFLIVTFIISLIIELINKYFGKFFKSQENYEFDNQKISTLLITTNEKIDELDIVSPIKSKSYSDGEYRYTFVSNDYDELNKIAESIDNKVVESFFIESPDS